MAGHRVCDVSNAKKEKADQKRKADAQRQSVVGILDWLCILLTLSKKAVILIVSNDSIK
jgi:hypothetical protein